MKLTKEEQSVIEKYQIEIKKEEGFVLGFDDSDNPCTSILKLKAQNPIRGEVSLILCVFDKNHFEIIGEDTFYLKRKFKNAKVGSRYIFWNSEEEDTILGTLESVDQDSESPFKTTKGNFFKFIKEVM